MRDITRQELKVGMFITRDDNDLMYIHEINTPEQPHLTHVECLYGDGRQESLRFNMEIDGSMSLFFAADPTDIILFMTKAEESVINKIKQLEI